MSQETAAAKVGLAVESGLAALQTAWSDTGAAAAPPVTPPAESGPPPGARSFLDLRAVPQIDQADATRAFTMTAPGYPDEWKEQVRQLRTRLNAQQAEAAMRGEDLQVVAISGCRTAATRHEIAANVALTLSSLRDVRVLVIDAKLSAPDMGITGPGLCEASRAARLALPACLRRVTGTQLYMMPAGDPSANPFDPLDLRGLHDLLRNLRPQFDWILMDCPGFDTPSDAMSLTMLADGSILTVERGQDSFDTVSRALGQIQGRRLLGAILL